MLNFLKKKNKFKIEVPKGYTVDENESTYDKIVLKRYDYKPRTWDEFHETCKLRNIYYGYVNGTNHHISGVYHNFKRLEENIAFVALGKLILLRDEWIGDFYKTLDDYDVCSERWYVVFNRLDKRIDVIGAIVYSGILGFPSKEMAEDFRDTFSDLINDAKMFL